MIMHMSIQISQSGREGERMCEGSQGGQSRQAFMLALLRDARVGEGECAADCTVTDRRCTCGRAGVACDHAGWGTGRQGTAKCTSLSSTSALLECKCNADYCSRR